MGLELSHEAKKQWAQARAREEQSWAERSGPVSRRQLSPAERQALAPARPRRRRRPRAR